MTACCEDVSCFHRRSGRFRAWLSALGLGVALVIAGVAAAEARPGRGERMFDRVDLNGDDRLSRREIRAARERRFERLDLDRDGAVTLEEIRIVIAERPRRARRRDGSRTMRLDRNRDGVISRAEFVRRRGDGRADVNGDGFISRNEFFAALERRRNRR